MRTKPIPLVRASQIRPFLSFMDHVGAPCERYLRQVKLPLLIYDNADAVLPELFLWKLVHSFERNEKIEDFGLRTALLTPLWKSEHDLVVLLQSQATLWLALTTFCYLTRQVSTAVTFNVVRDNDFALLQRTQRPDIPGEDQAELYDLMLMIQLVQLACGRDWMPDQLHVSKANSIRLKRNRKFEKVLIRPCNSMTRLAFPSKMLAEPLNPAALSIEQHHPGPLTDEFTESLKLIVASYLREGSLNIHLAAEMAGLSKRTFQRRLSDAQINFKTLVDQVRFKKAASILKTPGISITETAYDLGYSDAAHFTRAFRRWTALSPLEYQRQFELA